jgi:hypothetical protein
MDLPGFPLTGIYAETPGTDLYPDFDQALLLCADCGHAQLLNVVDPHFLYVQTYSHRSSASELATQNSDFFASFIDQISGGRVFESVVEVGCNDLYLLKKFESRAKRLYGVDPFWKEAGPREHSKISVIGKFIEEVDLEKEIQNRPDLVISAHTLEHLENPRTHLETLMRFASEEAVFVIAVPGFDSLLRTSRFDQVFHQHVQYFSVASFRRLIGELGGRYLTHTFNDECWNGTLVIAFSKGSARISMNGPKPGLQDVASSLALFEKRMKRCVKFLETLEKPVYGYGAAQMLPTLAYHLGESLEGLECILDDDPRREGLFYPRLNIKIRRPWRGLDWSSATVMITALDSTRAITRRLIPLKPKYFFAPNEQWEMKG